MVAEESSLRFALLAQAGNASRDIEVGDARQALLSALREETPDLAVKPFFPENFLVICPSQNIRDRLLSAGGIPIDGTVLTLRPWTRLAHARRTTLYKKVAIEIDSVPPHAWNMDTAAKLLSGSCWIERLAPETAAKTDLSTFKLQAWTDEPRNIPTTTTLFVEEPETSVVHSDSGMQLIFGRVTPFLREKAVLSYPVIIHVRRVTDFGPRTPSSSGASSPSTDGDSGPDGNPDRSYGFRRGTAPRLDGFYCRRGIPDDAPAGAAAPPPADRSGGRKGCSGQISNPVARQKGKVTFAKGALFLASGGSLAASEDRQVHSSAVGATIGGVADEERVGKRNPTVEEDAAAEAQMLSRHVMEEAAILVWDPMLLETAAGTPKLLRTESMITPVRSQRIILETRKRAEAAKPVQSTTPEADDELTALLDAPPGFSQRVTSSVTETTPRVPTAEPTTQPAAIVTQPLPHPGEGTYAICRQLGEQFEDALLEATPSRAHEAAVEEPSPPTQGERLRQFLGAVKKKIPTPLAPKPVRMKAQRAEEPITALPKRSRRLAEQPLANVTSSKRAEVILMRRFEVAAPQAPITATTKKAYLKFFEGRLDSSDMAAAGELFPSLRRNAVAGNGAQLAY
ncbi:unnamed protein product [Urochloa humidicola]